MQFTIFDSPKAQKGQLCTAEMFTRFTMSDSVKDLCAKIAREEDPDKRGALKKQLPVITWQAAFDGRRVAKEAKPSGLFMLDIDHVEHPFQVYSNFVSRIKELGIMFVGMTASQHGLRIVAKCRKEYSTIEQCQQWLAKELDVEYDGVCKDWARSSFVVHDSYTYYLDQAIFTEEPEDGTVYSVSGAFKPNLEFEKAVDEAVKESKKPTGTDQREGLFGGPTEYKGIPYETIVSEYLEATGGFPEEGERNSRLYKLAMRLRYITDFNAATMARFMPDCGLSEEEVRSIIHSALSAPKASDVPRDLTTVIENIKKRNELTGGEEEPEFDVMSVNDNKIPSLPPIFRQWYEAAPDDFKQPVVLAQLPILGTLASRLRAKYMDGKMHSPSFQVSLEAPQASGKSFLGRLIEVELKAVIDHDEEQREKEREYQNKVAELKVLNIKVNPDNKDEILGQRPESIVRYVPATMSITKLLMRMSAARGLHLFAFAPEIDTVLKAFKRGFSSFSDALRMAFDNDLYGQDYASDNSFSGNVRLYYNCLFSGTPNAMRRFYPDVEDGLVSRVLFITLPDQFGKRMPVWKPFDKKQQSIMDLHLERLNEVTLEGDDPMPEHILKLDFVNRELEKWIIAQQARAVKENDRTRDVFCRRAAVVGFRAAMLAYFLWGEHPTPPIRRNTVAFAIYVANSMLNQHLLRFRIDSNANANTNRWDYLFKALPDTFTQRDLQNEMTTHNVKTAYRTILYNWRLLGVLENGSTKNERNERVYTKIKPTQE